MTAVFTKKARRLCAGGQSSASGIIVFLFFFKELRYFHEEREKVCEQPVYVDHARIRVAVGVIHIASLIEKRDGEIEVPEIRVDMLYARFVDKEVRVRIFRAVDARE